MKKKSFVINTSGNRTTEEVIAAGMYIAKEDCINGENFPMRPMPAGPRKIVFLEFDRNPSTEEVLAEAERQGLERPRYEDALFFGAQHREEQRNGPIVFLHEPWQDPPCHELFVMVLYCGGRNRFLDLDYFDNERVRPCRFAFVQK